MLLWETNISAGCVVIYVFLVSGFTLIMVGGFVDVNAIGQLGLGLVCSGLTLVIVRDNQRTRRMLRRPGEHVGPMRSVPDHQDHQDWR